MNSNNNSSKKTSINAEVSAYDAAITSANKNNINGAFEMVVSRSIGKYKICWPMTFYC